MNGITKFFALLVFVPLLAYAQTDVNKMLQEINGKVDEIVIKSEGKIYSFDGDEAAKLFASMKEDKKMKHFSFETKDEGVIHGDSLHKKIIIKKFGDNHDDEKDVLVYVDENDSDDAEMKKIEKKVIVSNEGGEKIVKVTINEDGKENIEVYEGKAADEYFEKMKSEKECDVKIENGPNCCDKKHKEIIIKKEKKTE